MNSFIYIFIIPLGTTVCKHPHLTASQTMKTLSQCKFRIYTANIHLIYTPLHPPHLMHTEHTANPHCKLLSHRVQHTSSLNCITDNESMVVQKPRLRSLGLICIILKSFLYLYTAKLEQFE